MKNRGFTLIEVLVAMVLVSMVILVITMGLRLALKAFDRVTKEGDAHRIITAVPSLMGSQLQCIKGNISFKKGTVTRLPFYGKPHGFSFFTAYSPEGSRIKGLARVTWLFDKNRHILLIYEKSITRVKALEQSTQPLSDEWNGELKPVSILNGVDNFRLQFMRHAGKKGTPRDTEWKDSWKSSETALPVKVMLEMHLTGLPAKKSWQFEVGFGI